MVQRHESPGPGADVFEAWSLGLNLGPEPDLAAVRDSAAGRLLAEARANLVGSYARMLLQELDADPDRLAAAAAACRAPPPNSPPRRPADRGQVAERAAGDLAGATPAEAALQILHATATATATGTATDPAAPGPAPGRARPGSPPTAEPYRQGRWHRHGALRRRLRRHDPSPPIRRRHAARRLQLVDRSCLPRPGTRPSGASTSSWTTWNSTDCSTSVGS